MTTFSRPLRRLALLTAALATTATVTPTAASAAPPAPTGADLPTTAQVDDTFGYLAGGTRTTLRSNRLEVPDDSCLYQGPGVRAQARFASYVDAEGSTGFFTDHQDPTFVVYQFASKRKARAGYAAIADYVSRCQGRTEDDRATSTVRSVRVPRLGQRQLGYRTITRDRGGRREDLEVYVLQGSRIERSWIQLDRVGAQRAKVVAMARLLRQTAR